MGGLFDVVKDGAKASANSFGGILSSPIDKVASYTSKAGIPFANGDIGTSEWLKKKGLMFNGVPQGIGSDLGSIAGTTMAMQLLGQQTRPNEMVKALAQAYLLNAGADFFKNNFMGQ